MKPTGINNLSAEDSAVILELAPILDIAFVKEIGASERKFSIETKQGIKQMLRIFSIKGYERAKEDNRAWENIASAGINVSRQVSEGFCNDGALVYQLWTWIDGEDLAKALPRMNPAEQFAAGLKSGEAARKIHSLPMIDSPEPWGIRYRREVQKTIQSYNEKSAKSREKDLLVRYLRDNQELLDNRPTTFAKGDWNIANLMITPDGRIWVIDLGAYSGDPWWEFWEVGEDAHFNTGQIKGYFEDEPPAEYFPLLSYYIAKGYLDWRPDDTKYVLNWFDDMRNPVPNWYLKDYKAV